MNFRYEKIQSELTHKMKEINHLNIKMEEQSGEIKKMMSQNEHLEMQVKENQTELRPNFEKLKSQYDICLLEIKSLENDNNV